jgi:hypothetical protein
MKQLKINKEILRTRQEVPIYIMFGTMKEQLKDVRILTKCFGDVAEAKNPNLPDGIYNHDSPDNFEVYDWNWQLKVGKYVFGSPRFVHNQFNRALSAAKRLVIV